MFQPSRQSNNLGGTFAEKYREMTTLDPKKQVHPGRLTWNLRIYHWKRKIIFQTIIFRFYVNLRGCINIQRKKPGDPLIRPFLDLPSVQKLCLLDRKNLAFDWIPVVQGGPPRIVVSRGPCHSIYSGEITRGCSIARSIIRVITTPLITRRGPPCWRERYMFLRGMNLANIRLQGYDTPEKDSRITTFQVTLPKRKVTLPKVEWNFQKETIIFQTSCFRFSGVGSWEKPIQQLDQWISIQKGVIIRESELFWENPGLWNSLFWPECYCIVSVLYCIVLPTLPTVSKCIGQWSLVLDSIAT